MRHSTAPSVHTHTTSPATAHNTATFIYYIHTLGSLWRTPFYLNSTLFCLTTLRTPRLWYLRKQRTSLISTDLKMYELLVFIHGQQQTSLVIDFHFMVLNFPSFQQPHDAPTTIKRYCTVNSLYLYTDRGLTINYQLTTRSTQGEKHEYWYTKRYILT